jgi:hypothetical protein
MSLALVFLLLPSADAGAQAAHPRRGFWLVTGGGIGHTFSDCDQCDVENEETGSYLSLALGGIVSRKVLIGVELNAWYRASETSDRLLLGGFTVAQWYPWMRHGLHLRSGVGWSYSRSDYQTGEVGKLGLGLRLGAGWDVRVSRMVSISPFLGIHIAALGDKDIPGGTLQNLLSASRQVGVGVTIH